MNGFNVLLLVPAGLAVLLFVLIAVMMVRRRNGQGLEPPDLRPIARPDPVPAPLSPPPLFPDRPPYAIWRLAKRDLANPNSAGGPLYRLRLTPEQGAPVWRAGAVACIYCGPAAESATGPAPSGDYMIGSLPGDGAVDLVVRLVPARTTPEGRRSRFLCEELRPGDLVAMALRDDPDFVPPPDKVPLILIGNATGIAGLYAHIRARPPGTRNWLIFGDRNSAGDRVLAAELADWVSTGHLERCDLVLPGEGSERRHVTDQIQDASLPFLDWALAGGAIYVCGSRMMGDDVHATLAELLGADVLEAMAEAGLYRRSVY